MRDATIPDYLQADDPGPVPPATRLARWPVSARFSWSLAAAALALAVVTMAIAIADGNWFILAILPGPMGATCMGGLVAVRRPGQPMGTLLCAYGLSGTACSGAAAYALAAVAHSPAWLPAGKPMMWVTSWDWVPAITFQVLVLPLVFPSGRLLSRKWRPALWAAVAFVLMAIAGNAFNQESMGAWFANRPNPYAVPGPLFRTILALAGVVGVAAAGAAAVSVAVRWRQGGPVVRQQLKWFLATVPITIAVALTVQFFPDALVQSLVLGVVASLLPAVVIGLAVLRYRLYEIDTLLSRATVYGLLSVAVAAIYLAVVAVAGELWGVGLSMQVIATVMAAAVLLPVHGRLQRRVDRLFFGDRGAPYTAMTRLGRQVEEATTAEPLLSSVVNAVADSLRLPYAAVQLRIGDGWVPGACWGQAPAEVATFPLTFQRETVGRLVVGQRAAADRLSPDDERLLINLSRQVAPAAHAVALRKALDASRAGLVTAREEERRRLRRDLHDELGSAIAGLTLGLDTARAMSTGCRELEDLLSRLKSESQRAVADIRRIVYGLRPPTLDELGFAGALREETAHLEQEAPGLSIGLYLNGEGLDGLPAAIEVAAYRIVTEALTNVLRHAHAGRCEVRIQRGQDLRLEICDDGAGMPEGWRAGVGITVMRERVAELGGELTLERRLPRGTRIDARLPIGSNGE
jgi:signal transduction histidine kinase